MKEERTQFLKNSIREYVKYSKTEEHEKKEGYKWAFIEKHNGILNDLDNIQQKIRDMGSQNFFPFMVKKGVSKFLADKHEKEFIKGLKILYDENEHLGSRIKNFLDTLNFLLDDDSEWKNKDFKMDVDSASFFLFLRDPKKYLLYRPKDEFKIFAKKFYIYDEYPIVLESSDKIARYTEWMEYCKKKLIPLMNEEFNRDADMLDAQDLIFCTVHYFSDNLKALNPKERKLEVESEKEKLKMRKILEEIGNSKDAK
jgi:hypothetical protein